MMANQLFGYLFKGVNKLLLH